MVSKKSKRPKKPQGQPSHSRERGINPLYLLIPVALVLLVGGGWLLATTESRPNQPRLATTESSSDQPRLVFDETSFDFGTVPLNQVVEHDFLYRNAGDGLLVLQDDPEAEALEGC